MPRVPRSFSSLTLLQVPVGGAIVASPSRSVVEAVSRCYPGRAALTPVLDLFITLLELGTRGLHAALAERKAVADRLRNRVAAVAAAHGERLLVSRGNPISFAMSIDTITGRKPLPADRPSEATRVSTASGTTDATALSARAVAPRAAEAPAALTTAFVSSCSTVSTPVPREGGVHSGATGHLCEPLSGSSVHLPASAVHCAAVPARLNPTYLGSMLFSRGVSGTRVVAPGDVRPENAEIVLSPLRSDCLCVALCFATGSQDRSVDFSRLRLSMQ
jgi:hypothetical protein